MAIEQAPRPTPNAGIDNRLNVKRTPRPKVVAISALAVDNNRSVLKDQPQSLNQSEGQT